MGGEVSSLFKGYEKVATDDVAIKIYYRKPGYDTMFALPYYEAHLPVVNKAGISDQLTEFAKLQVMDKYGNVGSVELLNSHIVAVGCNDTKHGDKRHLYVVFSCWPFETQLDGRDIYVFDSLVDMFDHYNTCSLM